MTTVTICIPSIPRRADWLGQAVASVARQTVPCRVSIDIDHGRTGAWNARNAALAAVPSWAWGERDWIGFLDDDDYLLPHHVDHLLQVADAEQADVVWPWFEVEGGTDPFPQHRGKPYDPAAPHIFPITYLARASVMMKACTALDWHPFRADPDGTGNWLIQDMPLVNALWEASGGRFAASTEVTWVWRHHGSNTSGLPGR